MRSAGPRKQAGDSDVIISLYYWKLPEKPDVSTRCSVSKCCEVQGYFLRCCRTSAVYGNTVACVRVSVVHHLLKGCFLGKALFSASKSDGLES